MYKCWKFVCDESYSGGMGIVAADSLDAAKQYVDLYAMGFGSEFHIEGELTSLSSTKEGLIDASFYVE